MQTLTQKRCSRCRQVQPVSAFHRRRGQDGYQAYCKPCSLAKNRERQKDPEWRRRANEQEKARYRTDPDKYYWRNLRLRHGLTQAEHAAFLHKQNHACAICLTPFPADPIADRRTQRRIYVDHDHASGLVRGLLCPGCNTAVGLMKDDPATAERIASYLRQAI